MTKKNPYEKGSLYGTWDAGIRLGKVLVCISTNLPSLWFYACLVFASEKTDKGVSAGPTGGIWGVRDHFSEHKTKCTIKVCDSS